MLRVDVLTSRKNAYSECLRRIDNLVRLQTSAQNIGGALLSDEEYATQRAALLSEKANLECLINDAEGAADRALRLSEGAFEVAQKAQERFAVGNHIVKKEILLTVGSNFSLKDKNLCIEAKKPFFIIENSRTGVQARKMSIERENNEGAQGLKHINAPPILSWCGSSSDVRTIGQKDKHRVRQIWRFFRKLIQSGTFKPSEWKGLYHEDSIEKFWWN